MCAQVCSPGTVACDRLFMVACVNLADELHIVCMCAQACILYLLHFSSTACPHWTARGRRATLAGCLLGGCLEVVGPTYIRYSEAWTWVGGDITVAGGGAGRCSSCQVTFPALDGQRWPRELGVGTRDECSLLHFSLPLPSPPPLPTPIYKGLRESLCESLRLSVCPSMSCCLAGHVSARVCVACRERSSGGWAGQWALGSERQFHIHRP